MQGKRIVALLGTLCVASVLMLTLLSLVSMAATGESQTDVSEAGLAAPQAAAIIITKTVGTDPTVCAATDNIDLPPGGGQVTYCYTVRNTGAITLSRHTLVDDRLGAILTNFVFNLQPDGSAFITQTAAITTTTINSATWTAFNPGPIDVAFASDTATVNVALPKPEIVLTMTVGTNPALCAAIDNIALPAGGGQVTYCYIVKNTGNVALTRHTLVDDHAGTLLTNFPYVLQPNVSAFITQTATIIETTVNSASWIASNPGPIDMAVASDHTTVNVAISAPAIVLTKTVGTNPTVCAATDNIDLPAGGGQVTYCYTVRNTGNIALTQHTLVDDRLGSILTNFPFNLQPNASTFVTQTSTIVAPTANSATWTAFNSGRVNVARNSDTAHVDVEPRPAYLPWVVR